MAGLGVAKSSFCLSLLASQQRRNCDGGDWPVCRMHAKKPPHHVCEARQNLWEGGSLLSLQDGVGGGGEAGPRWWLWSPFACVRWGQLLPLFKRGQGESIGWRRSCCLISLRIWGGSSSCFLCLRACSISSPRLTSPRGLRSAMKPSHADLAGGGKPKATLNSTTVRPDSPCTGQFVLRPLEKMLPLEMPRTFFPLSDSYGVLEHSSCCCCCWLSDFQWSRLQAKSTESANSGFWIWAWWLQFICPLETSLPGLDFGVNVDGMDLKGTKICNNLVFNKHKLTSRAVFK